jgi:outer membrane protein insertion porin family
VGKVTVTGDSGMSLETFRRHAISAIGAHVDHDTVNRALDGVLRDYQRQDRLEADVKLESAQYDAATKAVDYRFSANRGPVVKVEVHGAAIDRSASSTHPHLSGRQRRRRPAQRRQSPPARLLSAPGLLRCARSITNPNRRQPGRPFSTPCSSARAAAWNRSPSPGIITSTTATLMDLLSVHAADVLDRHGLYSQALVSADVSALEACIEQRLLSSESHA